MFPVAWEQLTRASESAIESKTHILSRGTVRQGNRTGDYQGQIHLRREVDVDQQSQGL